MIEDLVLHERTRHELERFLQSPSHSILLLGAEGTGKGTLARALIAALLGAALDKLAQHSYVLAISPEKQTISIEAIRKAQEFVRLKTTGRQALRRAILVEDAHCLTIEAQNAFLKLLEEPPKDTLIVMTAASRDALLPTILSRTQKIVLQTPPQHSLAAYFAQRGVGSAAIAKGYHMTNGRVGLMARMLDGTDTHPLLAQIDTAKKLLQLSPFERLAMVDGLAKKKDELPHLLWALQRVSDAALYQASQKQTTKQIQYWHRVLKAVVAAQNSLTANPQPKLLLTDLMLSL